MNDPKKTNNSILSPLDKVTNTAQTRITRARIGISWYFFNLGMLVGNYVSRLPSIKEEHHLSDGTLGLVLLACAFGTMICLPFVGRFNNSHGSGMSTFVSSIGTAVVVPLIGINDHKDGLGTLVTGMFSVGFGMGFADVSANAQAVLVETQANKPQMGFFHAAYASGSFFGALMGGAFAEAGVSPFMNIFIVSAASMLASLFFFPTLYTNNEEKEIYKKIEGFVAYMAEGSVEDWTTVYFTETLNATPIMCSIGFAVFALAIAIGRFLSDGLVQRFGSVKLLQISGTVSAFGLVLVVMAPSFPLDFRIMIATCALGVSGAGLSLASPIVSSSAGRVPGMLPADSLSFVTSFGYSGYFIGPPLFGGLAEILGSLRWSLLVDAGLILIIALAANQIPEDAQYKNTMREGKNSLDLSSDKASKQSLLGMTNNDNIEEDSDA